MRDAAVEQRGDNYCHEQRETDPKSSDVPGRAQAPVIFLTFGSKIFVGAKWAVGSQDTEHEIGSSYAQESDCQKDNQVD